MSRKLVDYIPAVLVASIIMYITLMTGESVEAAGLGKESYHINGHFLLFAILCVVLFKPLKFTLAALILTVLYGVFTEVLQFFVPGRSASLFDVFTDTMGALIAVLIIWKFEHLLPKTLRNWLNH